MILEQITEVSNRSFSSHNFSEINNAINLASESKKPILLKKNKTLKKITKEELQEKIKRITSTKKNGSKNKSKKSINKKPKEIEETSELVKEEIDELRIVYAQLEAEYNMSGIDYKSLFSYLEQKTNLSEDYGASQDISSPNSLIMSDQEAAKTMEKVQLSLLIGNKDDISYQEKEKISSWVSMNKTLCSLYEVLSPIKNRNVDYSKLM